VYERKGGEIGDWQITCFLLTTNFIFSLLKTKKKRSIFLIALKI
jgi:hypothetical protein